MTIEHANIPEPYIHEPKGVASANSDTVYIADGEGSGFWGAVPKGSISIASTVSSYSTADQDPTTLDVPITVQYDESAVGDDVTIDANGTATIQTDGVYAVTFTGRVSRTTGGGFATLMVRALVDDQPTLYTIAETLDDGAFSIPISVSRLFPFVAGQEMRVEVMRDGGGTNNGGLRSFTPNLPDWAPVPSAVLRFQKVEVV